VLEGILWILRSGARWQDLPEEFPSPSTCWRRLRDGEGQGVWLTIWRAFLAELNERQQLQWSEAFLDSSFALAKKGARESAKPSGARGRSGWWWSTARVFLWETTFTLPPPSEVKLGEIALVSIRLRRRLQAARPRQKPERVIMDRGYDSDGLRKQLRRRGIEPIVPHRKGRRKPPTQDGRALRRYKRRWIIERTIAWLGNFRRLAVRYDRSLTIYRGFFHIACFMITLRRVLK